MVDVQNLAIGAAAGAGAALLIGGKPLGSVICPNCGTSCCCTCKCCPNCSALLSQCSRCGQCCTDRTTKCPNCGRSCGPCPRCSHCCCAEDHICHNCRRALDSTGYGLVGDS